MRILATRVAIVAALLVLVEANVGTGLRAQDASDWWRVMPIQVAPGRVGE